MGREIVGAVLAKDIKRSSETIDAPHKPSTVSVPIQNDTGRYAFVPEDIAAKMVKDHTAVILDPSMPDYMDGIKKALGKVDGFASGESVIQQRGKTLHGKDIGLFDTDKALEQALIAQKDYDDRKASGKLEPAETPADPVTFKGKRQAIRFVK